MKTLYCIHFKDLDLQCCNQCHTNDEMFVNYHKGFKISHCCNTLREIITDIDNHDEDKENDCQ